MIGNSAPPVKRENRADTWRGERGIADPTMAVSHSVYEPEITKPGTVYANRDRSVTILQGCVTVETVIGNELANIALYVSMKSSRMARSACSAEKYAMKHDFDDAFVVLPVLQQMLRRQVTLKIFKVSKSL